jgi:hypothetical protein
MLKAGLLQRVAKLFLVRLTMLSCSMLFLQFVLTKIAQHPAMSLVAQRTMNVSPYHMLQPMYDKPVMKNQQVPEPRPPST